MTKVEKKKLIEAIRFLATDAEEGDGFHDGMEILFKLAGLDTSYFDILKELKPMSATEFVRTSKGEKICRAWRIIAGGNDEASR